MLSGGMFGFIFGYMTILMCQSQLLLLVVVALAISFGNLGSRVNMPCNLNKWQFGTMFVVSFLQLGFLTLAGLMHRDLFSVVYSSFITSFTSSGLQIFMDTVDFVDYHDENAAHIV